MIVYTLLIATILIAVGLSGIYARHIGSISTLGVIGVVLALVGLLGMIGVYLLAISIDPDAVVPESFRSGLLGLANSGETEFHLYIIFVISFAIGCLYLGWLMFRAALLPLAPILLMMLGVGAFVLGLGNDSFHVTIVLASERTKIK